jgi:hypothetical protein
VVAELKQDFNSCISSEQRRAARKYTDLVTGFLVHAVEQPPLLKYLATPREEDLSLRPQASAPLRTRFLGELLLHASTVLCFFASVLQKEAVAVDEIHTGL